MANGRMEGRVAIVTGAGQGAGYGGAVGIGKEGGSVVLMGRTRSKLESTAKRIAEVGGKSAIYAGDVTKKSDMDGVIDLAIKTFGRVDALVCAAQSPEARWGWLVDVTEAEMEELWKSGAMATLAFMRAVRPHMLKTGGGSIINFGSGSQHNPTKYGVYAGVKAAIQAISRAAAQEWGREGIRVNTVLPFVASPAATHDFTTHPGVEQAAIGRTAVGRLGDPELDIGPAIAFLASDDSRYITGSTLSLDGGITYLR